MPLKHSDTRAVNERAVGGEVYVVEPAVQGRYARRRD